MQLVYLFKGLECAPSAVERIVARIPTESYDEKRDPERFTLREAVAHLRDWEPINLDRLRRGVEEPGCTVLDIDEGQMAIDGGYAARDPRDEARRFAALRRETVAYLETLKDEDWAKTYVHSVKGHQTVLEQAVAILGHDVYHLDQFAEYL